MLCFVSNNRTTWSFRRWLPAVSSGGKPGGGCFMEGGIKDREKDQMLETHEWENQFIRVVERGGHGICLA